MYEVEMKFRVDSLEEFEQRIAVFGVTFDPPVEEIDQFYQHPSRNFAETDEGLRIRRRVYADGTEEKYLTYKGPKIDPVTKTRKELEVRLGDTDPWNDILESLSFHPAMTVAKIRRYGKLAVDDRPFEILLDMLPELIRRGEHGNFVEIETIADETAMEPARQAVIDLAAELGLTENVRMGYLELLGGRSEY